MHQPNLSQNYQGRWFSRALLTISNEQVRSRNRPGYSTAHGRSKRPESAVYSHSQAGLRYQRASLVHAQPLKPRPVAIDPRLCLLVLLQFLYQRGPRQSRLAQNGRDFMRQETIVRFTESVPTVEPSVALALSI